MPRLYDNLREELAHYCATPQDSQQFGARERIRTSDKRIKSPLLYQLSYTHIMARAKGIEPLYLGSKPSALTVVLRPNHLMVLSYHVIKILSGKPTKKSKKKMELATGLEPATDGLQNRCATVAPRQHVGAPAWT